MQQCLADLSPFRADTYDWTPGKSVRPPARILRPIQQIGVIVIDMDPRYTGQMPIGLCDPHMRTVVRANNRLLRWAQRHCADNVFVAEYLNVKKDITCLLRPDEYTTIDEIFEGTTLRSRATTFKKIDYSAFHLTLLDEAAKQRGIKTWLVGGINSCGCVSEFVLDAVAAYGYRVILPTDSHLDNLEGGGTRIPRAADLHADGNYRYLRRDKFFTGLTTVQYLRLIDAANAR